MDPYAIIKVTGEQLMAAMITATMNQDDKVLIRVTESEAAVLHCSMKPPKISLVNHEYQVKSQDSYMLYLNGGWQASMSIVQPFIHATYETEDPRAAYPRLLPWIYRFEAAQVNQMLHHNELEIFKAAIDLKQGGK